jgi:hypothetical protein
VKTIETSTYGILMEDDKGTPFLYGDKRGPWLNTNQGELETLAMDRGLIAEGAQIVLVKIQVRMEDTPRPNPRSQGMVNVG